MGWSHLNPLFSFFCLYQILLLFLGKVWMCVCVCVCEREREREWESQWERERKKNVESVLCMCVCLYRSHIIYQTWLFGHFWNKFSFALNLFLSSFHLFSYKIFVCFSSLFVFNSFALFSSHFEKRCFLSGNEKIKINFFATSNFWDVLSIFLLS